MNKGIILPINTLLEQVEAELLRTGYSGTVIKRYRRVWSRLAKYMKERLIATYDPKIGLDFLDDIYQITGFKALTNENKKRARSIQMLNDYHLHGAVFPKYTTSSFAQLSHHSGVLKQFQENRNRFQMSNSTLKSYERYIGKFLLYLERQEIVDLSQITVAIILDYANIFAGYSSATTHNSFSVLRVFLRYFLDSQISTL